ncbi:MAG: DUF4159 domain-containing protein [Isosphaeraceae bacterium]
MSASWQHARDGWSRRQFVRDASLAYWSTAVAAGSGTLLWPAAGMGQDGSGPVDCGPPPRAKPQSRTGGESFPPLPLPATPLRRTEKKRPPAPPSLIGKMALGPIRYVRRGGERVQYRDWMTDPADLDSLLAWTNQKLGIHYGKAEADFEHFSFDPRELPALLFAGHNAFTVDPGVRASLARYVLDGGTILGDACCGWKDFDGAFRRAMQAIFPDRPLRKLEPDDPLLSSYYKLADFTYQKADGSRYEAAPCLEGIMVGCRTAVIYSPADLTCGWDGHDHPRGLRVVIDQARQIGANYVTYLLGSYQLGRFLSSTKVFHEAHVPGRDDFVFAQLVHDGDWDPDPSAVHNLLKHVRDHSTLTVKFKKVAVRPGDARAMGYPLLYMTGHHDFHWTDTEAAWLQHYLKAGGTLLADACCGRLAFHMAFQREIARVLPEHRLESLPLDHPLYHAHYDIRRVQYTPRVTEDFGALSAPSLSGISLDGRLAVIYSRFDIGNGWELFPHPYSYGYSDKDALAIGTNVIITAVTH